MKNGIRQYEPLWGEWYVDSLVGKGSFGEVYKIYKIESGKRIEAAAKYISIPKNDEERDSIYKTGAATDEESFKAVCDDMANNIDNEVNLMMKLKGSENIVWYESHEKKKKNGEIGWNIIIRMELLTPLEKYLDENKFTVADVIKLGIDICKAIDDCHKNDIIHRDVKMENIFVDKNGNFKLGDFGVSRVSSGKTTHGTVAGTEDYMAPEMLKKENYSSNVDIYSLGITLYKLLNKRRNPFLSADGIVKSSDAERASKDRISGEKSLPPPAFANEELTNIISKACAYDRHERYFDPLEMAEDLKKICSTIKNIVVLEPRNLPQPVLEKTILERNTNKRKAKKKIWIIPAVLVTFLAVVFFAVNFLFAKTPVYI